MLKALALVALLNAAPDSVRYSGRMGQLEVAPPKLVDAGISVDGALDEAAWGEAAILAGFSQYMPVEGIEASQQTEVRVFYTEEAIYFGIRAYDTEPELILARFGERDRVTFSDDFVRIILDTFDDQRQAYAFGVNPLGLQADGFINEGSSGGFGGRGGGRSGGGGGGGGFSGGGFIFRVDSNPDFIWESNGRVDSEGWTAEVRIPYVSLRFREVPVQTWGIQVEREVKRSRFRQSWAPVTREVSSSLAQSGRLVGLRDIHPRRLVEFNPVVTGLRAGTDGTGTFVRDDPEGDFGFNGRVGVTSNIVLDGTYNPDFSQIEADVSQITVNERFALFFPEKRAFFLEGAEIFGTPQPLVYTRQILDPIGGVKLTGKVGSFNVGYISALDESPSSILDAGGNAAFNLLRARRDVGSGSTVGLLYTDRILTDGSGAFNRVLSGDARLLLGGRYTLTTQLAGSFDRTESDDAHTGFKPLLSASLARTGREFSWNLDFTDIHPDFRARSGFITRAGDTQLDGRMSFTSFGRPGAVLERTSVSVSSTNFFGHDAFWAGSGPFEHELQIFPSFTFRGGRSLTFMVRNGYFSFQTERYANHTVVEGDGSQSAFTTPGALTNLKGLMMFPRMRINNAFSINGIFMLRETPIFAEASRGFEVQLRPDVQWNPTDRLQFSLNYAYSKIWRRSSETAYLVQDVSGLGTEVITVARSVMRINSEVYATVHVSNLRAQYLFNKALLARVTVQYELDEREALKDPTTGKPLAIFGQAQGAGSTGEFQGQLLLQYEPSPGTIFYVGFSRFMEGERSYRLSTMNPVEEGLFVKMSYLFRR